MLTRRPISEKKSTDAKLDVARSLAFRMEENEQEEDKLSYLNYTLLRALTVRKSLLPEQLHTPVPQAPSLKASMSAKAAQVRSGLPAPGCVTNHSYSSFMSSQGNSTRSKTHL